MTSVNTYWHISGPIKMSFPKVLTDLHAKLFATGEALGIRRNKAIVRSITPYIVPF